MGYLHGVCGPARRGLMLQAAGTSVLLSLLFVVVYGGTNWFTAQRPSAEVHTWYFAWEFTYIPYVPLLIVPYMSMDLFFFLATFLCRNGRELHTFARGATHRTGFLAAGGRRQLMEPLAEQVCRVSRPAGEGGLSCRPQRKGLGPR